MAELYFKKVNVDLSNTNYGNESFQGEVKVTGEADFTSDISNRILSYTGALTSNDMKLVTESNMAVYGVGITNLRIEEDPKKVKFAVWMKYLKIHNFQDPSASHRIKLGNGESSITVTITVVGE